MMRRYVPPNYLFLQEPHGVTSQKTPFFINEVVEDEVKVVRLSLGTTWRLMGTGCIDPCIVDLGASWRVVSFTPRPLYTERNSIH
jgi:hypothetical protein